MQTLKLPITEMIHNKGNFYNCNIWMIAIIKICKLNCSYVIFPRELVAKHNSQRQTNSAKEVVDES